MIKRHTRPKPIKNPSRMGGAAGHARRRDREGRADPDLERDARLPDLQPADARRLRDQGAARARTDSRSASASATTAARRSTSNGDCHERHTRPRLKERYERGAPRPAQGRARLQLDHARPADHEDHAQHGRRRREDRGEGARQRDRGADDDRRPARAGAQGPQVDRQLQAPRGDADRRARHAARRPHVGVPRPARLDRAPAHPRLPRARARSRSTGAATTRSASASRSSSRRSTTTTSRPSAGSTSRSRPRRRTTTRAWRCSCGPRHARSAREKGATESG